MLAPFLTPHFVLFVPGAFAVGVIMGYVADRIHRAAAPRTVRLHPDDRQLLYHVEARLRVAQIRATLLELYANGRAL